MKQIPNYPNYKITTDGKIWSEKTHKWLKPVLTTCNHHQVTLENKRSCFIHRLVLETFIGSCPPNMEGCHNNGIGTDNRLNNLRWDTKSNNRKDAIKHGVAKGILEPGEKHPGAKITEQDARTIVYLYRTKVLFQREIAKLYGVCRGTVTAIVNKNIWKHMWRPNE